jgi:hypothetical protein
LNKSTPNIPSECRIANIVRDHAMILPDDATPKPDEIFGKDEIGSLPNARTVSRTNARSSRPLMKTATIQMFRCRCYERWRKTCVPSRSTVT